MAIDISNGPLSLLTLKEKRNANNFLRCPPRGEITTTGNERWLLTGKIWSLDNEDLQRSVPNLEMHVTIKSLFEFKDLES